MTAITQLKKMLALPALIALALAALPAPGFATPPEGIVSATVYATSTLGFADPTDLKFRIRGLETEIAKVPDAEETVMQQIIIAPGGHTGWHSHPGPVVVIIKSGQMTFYDGEDPTCTAKVYFAGQSFVDRGQGHVHIARNEGTENLELWATYFDVGFDGVFRLDQPAPGNCPF